MKKIFAAIALTIASPAMAHAQAVPAPKADCCEKMNAAGKDCKSMAMMDHKKHDMKDNADPHAGHDMSQSGAKTPTNSHQNH